MLKHFIKYVQNHREKLCFNFFVSVNIIEKRLFLVWLTQAVYKFAEQTQVCITSNMRYTIVPRNQRRYRHSPISSMKEKRNLIIRRRDTFRVSRGQKRTTGSVIARRCCHSTCVRKPRYIHGYHLRYQFSVISLQITCRATSVIQLSQ